jgi:hypothetical protein
MAMPYDDMEAEDEVLLEDDMGGEEPMGMEDDMGAEYGGEMGPSMGPGMGLSSLGGSAQETNPTDQAFADTEMDTASAMQPLDEMFGEARIGAASPDMEDEFAPGNSMMPGAEAQEEDPGHALDMKSQLMDFLQNEAKARRARAETFQNRAREYMKNGGQR